MIKRSLELRSLKGFKFKKNIEILCNFMISSHLTFIDFVKSVQFVKRQAETGKINKILANKHIHNLMNTCFDQPYDA